MSDDKLLHIQELLETAASNLKTANALLRDLTGVVDTDRERHMTRAGATAGKAGLSVDGKVVEGIFDGQNMIDSGGQSYPVPANYASKSKLVEGDGMKLTITDIQEDGQYKVLADGKVFRVLLASVTFYRAEVGDQVTILLPEGSEASWGGIEAVIPKHIAEAAAKATIGGRSKKGQDGEMSPSLEE